MVAFDAEVYLRRLGERLLDDPDQQQSRHWSALRGAAAALVVAGTIAADQAWRVIDDYATATRIRSGRPGFVHFDPPLRRRTAGSLMPRRTMVIDQEIPVGEDQVLLRDLAVTADGGTLRYRRRLDAPGASQLVRLFSRPGGFPWTVTPPQIVDSGGNRPAVRPGNWGVDTAVHVDGELGLRGTIAPEAAWLEIDGTRVELYRRTTRWEVGIEALEDRSPVERFLWRHLAVADLPSGFTTDLEPLIQALVAADALDEESLLLKDVRAVAARMPRRPRHQRPLPGGSTRSLVEPWGSLLRRLGSDDGPDCTLVLGAVTPPCDGVQFAANSITSDLAGFEVEFEVAPNVLGIAALDELPVGWWARDDRDDHYLGSPILWDGSDDGAQGTMRDPLTIDFDRLRFHYRGPRRKTEQQTLRLLAAGGRLPDRLQATTAAIWARRLQTGHAALQTARPQLEAALYGRALRTLRAWLGQPQLAIELTMIEPAEQRRIVRTADGVDVSLPFSWLPDVWMRGLAVTFGRLCIAAETTDGSSWTLHTLGPDLADVTQLTIAIPS